VGKHHSQLDLFTGELTDFKPRHRFTDEYCLVWYKFYPTLPDLKCGMMKVPYTGTKPSWIPLDDRDERESIFRFVDPVWGSDDKYWYIDHQGNQNSFKSYYETKCRKYDLAPGQPFRALIKPPEGYRCSYEYDEWDTHYFIEYTHCAQWTDKQKKQAWNNWLLARRNYAARDLTLYRRILHVQKNHPEKLCLYNKTVTTYGDNKSQKIVWTLRSELTDFHQRFDYYPYYQNLVHEWSSPTKVGGFYTEEEIAQLEQEGREYIKAWLLNNTQCKYKDVMKFMKKKIIHNE
jgi:hypothetical protein